MVSTIVQLVAFSVKGSTFVEGIDVKCLKNKHKEELVCKEYFKQWLELKTKTNTPVMWILFILKIVKIVLFEIFDNIFIAADSIWEVQMKAVVQFQIKTQHVYNII